MTTENQKASRRDTEVDFPRFSLVRQCWPTASIPRPEQWVKDALRKTPLLEPIRGDDFVLITAGSRGIDSNPRVLAALVREVKATGGRPFILPAMGSHGGGTAEGQIEVLKGLGITEQLVGAPIIESMDFVQIGATKGGWPVFVDKTAAEADHIILVNRVTETTEWIGRTESGLLKMSVVGLGRRKGAESMHRAAMKSSILESIQSAAEIIFQKLAILGGVALLEDQYGLLRRVEAVPGAKIFQREPEILEEARLFRPKLPFDELDVLIVDEIGKEISGTGVDTRIIGRIMRPREKELDNPKIARVVIRDLTEASRGNAIGVGLADYTTFRILEKIDFVKTAVNCEVGSCPEKGRLPLPMPSDKAALTAALSNIGPWSPEQVRLAWIVNSKKMERLAVSKALLPAARRHENLSVEGVMFQLSFDEQGNMPFLASLLPSLSI